MRSIIALAFGLSAQTVAAHDFWVQPQVFAAGVGAPVPLTIQVGHGTARQRWAAPVERVVAFTATGPDGTRDRRAELKPGVGDADAVLGFAPAGTYVIALTTNHATSELPAIRFNDYASVEGLTPALATRTQAGTSNTPGRELYSRRAKALVRIGASDRPQPQVTTPLGMTLEIVPERDPYTLGPNAPLPVRVLYEGKPLVGALVKLNNLDFDAHPVATARTDPGGRAAFTVPFRGLWQLNVIWTKPIAGNPAADFDTTFSSLTFGTKQPGVPLETR